MIRASRPALVPELYVSELARSLGFYVDLLGFRVEYDRPEEKFASLRLGTAHLMLEEAPALTCASPAAFQRGEWRTAELEQPFGRGVNFEIEVADVAVIAERLAAHRYPLLLGLNERAYCILGQQLVVSRFLVADPDGYLIRPSQILSRS